MTIKKYKPNLAPRIKEARETAGYTQKQVEDELGISTSQLSKIENGKLEPNIETLGRLAKFYNISIDELIGLVLDK